MFQQFWFTLVKCLQLCSLFRSLHRFFLLYRFLELETSEVKLYSLVQKKVVNSIKALCKTVNQKMLLNNLHDTRICNQLIEPESTEEKWKGTFSSSQPQIGSPEKGKVLLIFLYLTIETLLLCKISYFEPTEIEKRKRILNCNHIFTKDRRRRGTNSRPGQGNAA